MIRRFAVLLAGVAVGALVTVAVTQPQFLSSSKAVAAGSDAYRQLNLFGDVFERVRADYVEAPDDTQLVESAINGMLTGLDPHSSYMNAKDYKDMQVTTSGKFGGLGIQVTMEDGVVKVIAPMDGTPAAKAGILANDKIIALDGDPLTGITLDQAVEKMRGDIGTPITLTILRGGDDKKPFDVKLTRAEIVVQAVTGRTEGQVIYVRLASFSENAFDGLKSNIDKLGAEIGADKVQGIVLDLRNDPGGLLDQAIAVSDAFLNEGEIVSTRGRRADETQRFNAHSGDLAKGKPVIILINGGSASASEIVAGALQDQRRATILGTRSFGKGSVQTIIPLGKDGALRLTTARYYTPSGRSIQAKGIEPDIEVIQDLPPDLAAQFTGEPRGEANLKGHLVNDDEKNGKSTQSGSLAYVPPDAKDDKQLQYALNLLRGLQVNAAFPPDPNRVIPN
jgi:carboxyl-terminal processing protease